LSKILGGVLLTTQKIIVHDMKLNTFLKNWHCPFALFL